MKENDYIEQHLKSIKKVDAPPFLLTRIEAKINAIEKNVISNKKIALAFSLTLTLIIGNIFFVQQNKTQNSDTTSSVFEEMNLNTSNQLYHD